MGNEIKMPVPKIPELTETPQYDIVDNEPDYEEEEGEGAPEVLVNAISKIIGFISTLGMPSELIVAKSQEYESIAEATGLSQALADLIEYYFPYIEDRPEIAVIFALLAYASFVIADRKQTMAEWNKKHPKKNKKKVEKTKKVLEKSKEAQEEKKRREIEAVMKYNQSGGAA